MFDASLKRPEVYHNLFLACMWRGRPGRLALRQRKPIIEN
jgi:hypothetical protein